MCGEHFHQIISVVQTILTQKSKRTLRYDEVKYFILNRNRYEDADSRITDKYSSRHETPDQKTQPEFSTQDQMH